MDRHNGELSPSAQEFNDYMIDNCVCQVSSRYSISLWNVL